MLQENLFATIAKIITQTSLKKNLNQAMREAENDMDLKTTISSLQYHVNELERLEKIHCQRYPDSKQCKDKAKK